MNNAGSCQAIWWMVPIDSTKTSRSTSLEIWTTITFSRLRLVHTNTFKLICLYSRIFNIKRILRTPLYKDVGCCPLFHLQIRRKPVHYSRMPFYSYSVKFSLVGTCIAASSNAKLLPLTSSVRPYTC